MSYLLPNRGPSRLLGLFAATWLVSAVFHSAVFLISDTAWSGAISWRKPIVFSASIGLVLWSFGWVLDRLPHRSILSWGLAAVFAASSTAEVGIVVLQQWRGRASHFNIASDQDAALFTAMGILVSVMAVCLVALFGWSLIERPADGLERIAVVAGMALVISSLGFGQWTLSLGLSYLDQFNRVPETVINGDAGVVKFPHAIGFHGIHVFMVAVALLRRSNVPTRLATLNLRVIVASYAGVLVFSALQTLGGRAPQDATLLTTLLLALSLIALIAGLAASLVWALSNSKLNSTDKKPAVPAKNKTSAANRT